MPWGWGQKVDSNQSILNLKTFKVDFGQVAQSAPGL
jgi:hypothetical protein